MTVIMQSAWNGLAMTDRQLLYPSPEIAAATVAAAMRDYQVDR
jgi:hypothetical protein